MKSIAAAVIFKNRSVLLTRRKAGEPLAGYWEFPGGKIENEETPQECLERELFEELGVQSKAGDIIAESIYEYPNGTTKLMGIQADLIDQDLVLTVHDKFAWVPVDGLLEYNLAPADIFIAEQLIASFKKRTALSSS